ncbi:MAG: nuclear transport factor 2 family protein [Polyangiaceae bacterium]
MSLEANKTVARTFFQRITAGDIPGAFALVSDDVSWWVAGSLPFSGEKTKAEYMVVVGRIQSGFPSGFALTPGDMTAEGDRVAVEVTSSGTHVNGKTYANKYHFLMVVKDGAIVRVKEYMDTQHLKDLIS